MKLVQKEFEKAWIQRFGDEFLQKDETQYTSAVTAEAFYWFEKGFERMKENNSVSYGTYWDDILDTKNALIMHLMDENRRLDKENESLKTRWAVL